MLPHKAKQAGGVWYTPRPWHRHSFNGACAMFTVALTLPRVQSPLARDPYPLLCDPDTKATVEEWLDFERDPRKRGPDVAERENLSCFHPGCLRKR
jgi:hypothetical protein